MITRAKRFIRRIRYPNDYAKMLNELDRIEKKRASIGETILRIKEDDVAIDDTNIESELSDVCDGYDQIKVLCEKQRMSNVGDELLEETIDEIDEIADSQLSVMDEIQRRIDDGEISEMSDREILLLIDDF